MSANVTWKIIGLVEKLSRAHRNSIASTDVLENVVHL